MLTMLTTCEKPITLQRVMFWELLPFKKDDLHFRMLSAPKLQRFLRFAIAMPIADPRNRVISETRESNAALRFKGAMESR